METILLVDDQPLVFHALKEILPAENFDLQFCKDGQEALSIACKIRPSVILQDLSMPGIDGFQLVSNFKANPETFEIPLVVLSSHEDPQKKAQAFALGANDYLVKLPDPIELKARLFYHAASYRRFLERNRAYTALAESEGKLKNELEEAATYVKNCLPQRLKEPPFVTDWIFEPSSQLGGDAFGYHWITPECFAIYMIDVCGHGVGAALLSTTVIHTIRYQTLPHVDFLDPAAVLAILNRTFKMEEHRDLFFTAWYGIVDVKKRILRFACGGHPPGVLFSLDNPSSPQLLKATGLVVGASPDSVYENQQVSLSERNRLYLFSDGAFEIPVEGDRLMMPGFLPILKKVATLPGGGLFELMNELKRLQKNNSFEDDVSLVTLDF